MPCYFPNKAYYARRTNKRTGKRGIVFNLNDGHHDRSILVPCGVCIGCRLERSRDWAIRIMHESALYDDNCFITLTYDDKYLPPLNSLRVSDFQNFMKRFRKAVKPIKIRFLHCGEYGTIGQRPHYHAVIFNYDFLDKEEIYINGKKTYVSELLQSLWTKGFSTVDELNYRTARYVAKYVTKKVSGKDAPAHYKGRKPEYITMSRRPGLASDFFRKYVNDFYPCDTVSIDGKVVGKPPVYYDKILEKENPDLYIKVKYERRLYANSKSEFGTRRLVQKGIAVKAQNKFFDEKERKLL